VWVWIHSSLTATSQFVVSVRFRNIKNRMPLVLCCPVVDDGLALKCMAWNRVISWIRSGFETANTYFPDGPARIDVITRRWKRSGKAHPESDVFSSISASRHSRVEVRSWFSKLR
jgi:hypothetical protein